MRSDEAELWLTAGEGFGQTVGDGETRGSGASDDKVIAVAKPRNLASGSDMLRSARESGNETDEYAIEPGHLLNSSGGAHWRSLFLFVANLALYTCGAP